MRNTRPSAWLAVGDSSIRADPRVVIRAEPHEHAWRAAWLGTRMVGLDVYPRISSTLDRRCQGYAEGRTSLSGAPGPGCLRRGRGPRPTSRTKGRLCAPTMTPELGPGGCGVGWRPRAACLVNPGSLVLGHTCHCGQLGGLNREVFRALP